MHGAWADRFAALLNANGLECAVVSSARELDARAAEKLMYVAFCVCISHLRCGFFLCVHELAYEMSVYDANICVRECVLGHVV